MAPRPAPGPRRTRAGWLLEQCAAVALRDGHQDARKQARSSRDREQEHEISAHAIMQQGKSQNEHIHFKTLIYCEAVDGHELHLVPQGGVGRHGTLGKPLRSEAEHWRHV